jgi:hypothetical protein
MLNRRHLLELAATALASVMAGGSMTAQAKTTTVTLTIDGMT